VAGAPEEMPNPGFQASSGVGLLVMERARNKNEKIKR